MKTFVDGSIWTETDARGVEQIGFRQSYIEQVLGECFHVVQADTRKARKGCPLMVLETNDGTSRVRSPVTGTILMFSDKARNFPDRLTEDDVIVEVLPEGMTLPAQGKKPEVRPTIQFNQLFNAPGDWLNGPMEVPAEDPETVRRRVEQQRVIEVQIRNAAAANRRVRRPR
jgi:glycine cleavage system H lipoate-binding protein